MIKCTILYNQNTSPPGLRCTTVERCLYGISGVVSILLRFMAKLGLGFGLVVWVSITVGVRAEF